MKHFRSSTVQALHEGRDGMLHVHVRLADGKLEDLVCGFQGLINLRTRWSDQQILAWLAERRLDVWVDQDTIVRMKTWPGARPQPKPRVSKRQSGKPVGDDREARARKELKQVKAVLSREKSWLRSGEREMLQSFGEQLQKGRLLTKRQLEALERFQYRADQRKLPRVFRG